MILDGYTWSANICGERILYRPVMKHERSQLIDLFQKDYGLWRKWAVTRLESAGTSAAAIGSLIGRFDWEEAEQDWESCGLIETLLGVTGCDANWEVASAKNLQMGVRLLRDAPGFDRLSCDECQQWRIREDGTFLATASGNRVRRFPEEALLCQTREGCPKGTPEQTRTLTEPNRMAFRHFRQCDAIGKFPNDPLVARNAILIRQALSEQFRG